MELLKGSAVTKKINENLKQTLSSWKDALPHLAIIRVGDNPDDISYEKSAVKKMELLGISHTCYTYPKTISTQEFRTAFQKINEDSSIDAILLLRPLPSSIDEKEIAEIIHPAKDIDGISPINIAKIFSGEKDGFAPCTAEAVMEMLSYTDIPLSGKTAVVIGRSLVVGRPLCMLLLNQNATVTICHSKTKNLPSICKTADILISCIGRPHMIDTSYVKENAVVIDVGINFDENGSLCGDVDSDNITQASFITPVPGGVGAVTTSILAKHVIKAAAIHRKLKD